MKVEFTGASLAIAAVTLLAANSVERRAGSPEAPQGSPVRQKVGKVDRGAGLSQIERQWEKLEMASETHPESFPDWAGQVQAIRGHSLTEGDPSRGDPQANEGETWYDVWLQGVSPEEAAKMGSMSLR